MHHKFFPSKVPSEYQAGKRKVQPYAHWIKDRLKGKTVHVVASGPSLKDFDYSLLSDRAVIAVNHSYKCVPWALWTVAGDRGFVTEEDPAAPRSTTFLCRNNIPNVVQYESISWFSMNPHDGVYCKKLSGILALMTAVHAGAEKIYLWGHDCSVPEGAPIHATSGKFKHRLDERKPKKQYETIEKEAHDSLKRRAKNYDRIALEVPDKIFNVEVRPGFSAIRCFPIVTPEQALKKGETNG
jgi:hypothetical protein